MSVNGISGYSQLDAYSAYQTVSKTTQDTDSTAAKKSDDETAAVYESSTESVKYSQNTEIVEMLKADQESYKNQLMSYVQQAIAGQGNALATSDDMWKFLASGNFTVSEEAKAEAQAALEEGGYWSVESTSDRILEMAKALTGGDPDQIEAMREAVEEGFKQATKTWGQDLPDISSKTYDAIMEKFDEWAEEAASE